MDSSGGVGVVYNSPPPPVLLQRSNIFPEDNLPTVGFIGRVAPDKGIAILLSAMRILSKSTPFCLILAGPASGSDMDEMRTTFGDLFDSGVVQLTGPMTANDFFSSVDIVAVPTQWQEPFGRVAAEALLAGKPLIHSQAGGLSEVAQIYGGQATSVRDYKSPEAWAEALGRALGGDFDADLPRTVGPEHTADAYLGYYEMAIRRRK